eukprot:2418754-Pyramimonas_sp.AAC.1
MSTGSLSGTRFIIGPRVSGGPQEAPRERPRGPPTHPTNHVPRKRSGDMVRESSEATEYHHATGELSGKLTGNMTDRFLAAP